MKSTEFRSGITSGRWGWEGEERESFIYTGIVLFLNWVMICSYLFYYCCLNCTHILYNKSLFYLFIFHNKNIFRSVLWGCWWRSTSECGWKREVRGRSQQRLHGVVRLVLEGRVGLKDRNRQKANSTWEWEGWGKERVEGGVAWRQQCLE